MKVVPIFAAFVGGVLDGYMVAGHVSVRTTQYAVWDLQRNVTIYLVAGASGQQKAEAADLARRLKQSDNDPIVTGWLWLHNRWTGRLAYNADLKRELWKLAKPFEFAMVEIENRNTDRRLVKRGWDYAAGYNPSDED